MLWSLHVHPMEGVNTNPADLGGKEWNKNKQFTQGCNLIPSYSVRDRQIPQPHVWYRLCWPPSPKLIQDQPSPSVFVQSPPLNSPHSCFHSPFGSEFVPGRPYFSSRGFSSLTGMMRMHAVPWTVCPPSVSCMVKESLRVSVSSCIYMIFIPVDQHKKDLKTVLPDEVIRWWFTF